MALLVLLTPIAFFLKIPYVIPIACGLVLSPVSMVAVACGTIVFYMLEYVREKCFISGRERRSSDSGDYISETGVSG